MPWDKSDAHSKTHKADTPAKQKQWSDVANSVLERTGDEARAVRTANGVIARARGRGGSGRPVARSRGRMGK
jgi:hypothetical protein